MKKKGFALLEILVVSSIMSMLASMVFAGLQPAQSRARDVARTGQVRQIDLAVQQYKDDHNGSAPALKGRCRVLQSGNPSRSAASGCLAVSSGNSATSQAWSDFTDDISSYMPIVPNDPCPTCESASSYPLGYTYIAPLAMQYLCDQNPLCNETPSELESLYQLYVPLEMSSGSGSGSVVGYAPGNVYTPVPLPEPPTVDIPSAGYYGAAPGESRVEIWGHNFTVSGNTVTIGNKSVSNVTAYNIGSSQNPSYSELILISVNPSRDGPCTPRDCPSVYPSIEGLGFGDYYLTVSNSNGTSNAVRFRYVH